MLPKKKKTRQENKINLFFLTVKSSRFANFLLFADVSKHC